MTARTIFDLFPAGYFTAASEAFAHALQTTSDEEPTTCGCAAGSCGSGSCTCPTASASTKAAADAKASSPRAPLTPEVFLERVIVQWRQNLPPRYTPAEVDGFIERERPQLLRVVGEAMALRRAQRGSPPRSAREFAGYTEFAKSERPKDAQADDAILRRLRRRMTKLAGADPSPEVQRAADSFAHDFATLRAEALVLRREGWDAIALLGRRPALALLSADAVVAVRDADGRFHPYPQLEAASAGMRAAWESAQREVATLESRPDSSTPIEDYAAALWARAREPREAPPSPAGASSSAEATFEAPPDEWTPARRAKANLAAMQVVATKDPAALSDADRRTLFGYSGWGGLSIDKYQDLFPEGWDPDRFGLVHEYYTPTKLATAVADAPASPAATASCGRWSPPRGSAASCSRSTRPSVSARRSAGRASSSPPSPRGCCPSSSPARMSSRAALRSGSTSRPAARGSRPRASRSPRATRASFASSSPTRPTASGVSPPNGIRRPSTPSARPSRTSSAAASICSPPTGSASF